VQKEHPSHREMVAKSALPSRGGGQKTLEKPQERDVERGTHWDGVRGARFAAREQME